MRRRWPRTTRRWACSCSGVASPSTTSRAAVAGFKVAIPSWGVGTGGTRFGRFPGPGEPRNVFEKLEDCGVIHRLTGATPTVSLHIPWDRTDDLVALREHARRSAWASTP